MSLKASLLAIALIKASEGFSSTPYDDGVGKQTIGWGHMIRPGEHFDTISLEEGEDLLMKDVAEVEDHVRSMVKVPLTQSQFDALVVFTFNFDPAKVAASHTMTLLNRGDYDAVPSRLKLWNKGRVKGKLVEMPGLTIRRAREAQLWNGTLTLSDIPKPRVR